VSLAVTVKLPGTPAVCGLGKLATVSVVAAAALMTIPLWLPVILAVTVSFAVRLWVPLVVRVAEKV
jgi:uncharacterized membrane protein